MKRLTKEKLGQVAGAVISARGRGNGWWSAETQTIYEGELVIGSMNDRRDSAAVVEAVGAAAALIDEVLAARKLARRMRRFLREHVEGTKAGKTDACHALVESLDDVEHGS